MRSLGRALPAAIVLLVIVLVLIGRTLGGGHRSAAPHSDAPAAPIAEAAPDTIGAWYDIAFTSPGVVDDRGRRAGGLEGRLVALMDRAQQTLDVAVYEFDLKSVADAMARAAHRGVRVRMVTDSDTLDDMSHQSTRQALAIIREAGIPIVPDNRKPIIHDKFTVVDGEWVETGSWNYTESDTYRNNNDSIIVQSRDLAANYTAEFEKMFTQRTFGGAKAAGVPHPSLSLTGARVENYFSPEDKTAAQVIRWLGTAHQQIHFMAFSFTHHGIADAMMARANDGVSVAGVFETEGSSERSSEYTRLKQAGLDVLQDGNPGRMHHKVILLDSRVSLFGSFNFSSAADRQNDENLLIADDPGLAAALEAEYQRVRATALNPPSPRF